MSSSELMIATFNPTRTGAASSPDGVEEGLPLAV